MATTVEVGNIQARITATTGHFDSAIRRVNTRFGTVKTSSKSLQDRIKSLNRSFDDLYQRLGRVSQVGGKMQKWFGGFLAAQTAAVAVALKQAATYAGEVNAVAGQTGIAVESIQALNYAVQQSDGDIKLLNTGLRALARRSAEAAQGNRTFAKYFDQLGVKVQNLDGSMRPLEDILMDVADRVQALGSESEASAALMGLMGDAGRQLVPFMRQGSAGIRELMREARSLGLVLDRETTSRLLALSDQANRARLGLGAIAREWALTFLPVAERIVGRIDGMVRAFHSLDEGQKDLIFRFGALTAAVMAGGFAFSTVLVLLPQLVRGLQIVMGVMSVFASPWVLGIAAVVAAAYLLKRAWEENLLGVQDRTEAVTGRVRRAWERLAGFFRGEPSIFDAPVFGADRGRERHAFALPALPAPNWDQVVTDAEDRLRTAWNTARAEVAGLAAIDLPGVDWSGWPTIDPAPLVAQWNTAKAELEALTWPELPTPNWPGWPEIDTAPLKAEWAEVKAEIEGLEAPMLPGINVEPFFNSWNDFVDRVGKLEAPPVPPQVENWADRVAESFKRTPGGQVTVNIGRLADEVMAGEKTLSEAVTELLSSNLSIPFTAFLWTLTPLGTGWKLALTGVTLALNFLPDVDLSASGIIEAINDASRKLAVLLTREDLVTIGDEQFSAAEISYSIGQALAEALVTAIEVAIGIAASLMGVAPEFATPAFELGKAIAENIVIPMLKGFVDQLTEELKKRLPKSIQDAWKAAMDFVSGRDETTIQVLADPAGAAREFREATQDREFQLRPQLTFGERVLGGLRALFRIRPLGTPEYQSGTPWTGWGPLNEVAGVVHRQEAVIPADVLREGPAAVLDFLGAPGFQGGKNDVPLFGAAAVQAEADRLTQLNEESLSQLMDMSGILGGLSATWDKAGARLEQIAADVPMVRDLVELVRILVGLVRGDGGRATITGGSGDRPTATLIIPRTPWESFVGWLKDRWSGIVSFARDSFLGLRYELNPLTGELEVAGSALTDLRDKSLQFAAGIIAALNPINILAQLFDALATPVVALLMPITMVVSALAQALLPVFKATFPIIKTFGVLLLTVLRGVSTVWNAIVGTIGNIFKSLSQISIFGWRPLKFLEGTANFFLGLQVDTKALADAQKELRDLTWEEAQERAKNIDAIKKTTEALRNVPSGFKIALARFQAATPVQSFATGGYVPATPGGRIVRVAEGGEGEYIVPESKMDRGVTVHVTIQGDVYGVDDLDRRITTAVGRAMRQSRMTAWGVT